MLLPQVRSRTLVRPKSPSLSDPPKASQVWDRNPEVPRRTFNLPEPSKIRSCRRRNYFVRQRMVYEVGATRGTLEFVETSPWDQWQFLANAANIRGPRVWASQINLHASSRSRGWPPGPLPRKTLYLGDTLDSEHWSASTQHRLDILYLFETVLLYPVKYSPYGNRRRHWRQLGDRGILLHIFSGDNSLKFMLRNCLSDRRAHIVQTTRRQWTDCRILRILFHCNFLIVFISSNTL